LARRVLIVAPHFPPSNLAGVHRSRLFAHHLPAFGWEPIVISVGPGHYEEKLDPNLAALVAQDLRVERVGALPTRPVRIVGDIGIRAFVPLLRRILKVIDGEGADFLYIPIPSFYASLLGRIVHRLRGIPYGIDYIDPWVHEPTGNENLKGKVALALAKLLEPVAVKDAMLITGVAASYYEPVLLRNPDLRSDLVTAAMPYGGEAADHNAVRSSGMGPTLFQPDENCFTLVYAGALLPRATATLERVCAALAAEPERSIGVKFVFIGTGKTPDDPNGYNVRPIAERYGVYGVSIVEYPARIPYLDVLAHLEAADGIFVLGSTEPHYTPSKIYQGVLANKPIFAILHSASTGCSVIQQTRAGMTLEFDGEANVEIIQRNFWDEFDRFRDFAGNFDPRDVDQTAFESYSARTVTGILASALDRALAAHQRHAAHRA